MARHSSKTLLPEFFTGSNDFESYVTHLELLSQLQKGQRKERVNGAETEIDESPHYFALRLQKSAMDFYRTFSEDTRKSYDETVKAFRPHYNEKPVVFRGRLARRVQQPGEKSTDFLGDLKTLALNKSNRVKLLEQFAIIVKELSVGKHSEICMEYTVMNFFFTGTLSSKNNFL